VETCTESWESLIGDPLPWLLDPARPNLHWRVLVELFRRPTESPAVARAKGGANAVEPVASLIEELDPDGTWAIDLPLWQPYSGPGWRLLAAVQWGADPSDPRLQAAAEVVLDSAPGVGGFSRRKGGRELPWLTARVLQGLADLGWHRHPRFEEGLAWLEDGAAEDPGGGWRPVERGSASGDCEVTAVAVVAALTASGDQRRRVVKERAVRSLVKALGTGVRSSEPLGHPCLGRTDEAEMLWALACASAPLGTDMVNALKRVQRRQADGGRWERKRPVPKSLPVTAGSKPGEPSRWVTLRCVVALMTYAVEAQLPRMYPQRPSRI
jgi:hypothetical protein